ncbi:MAG: DUF1097 domain-containing protein [Burkholderiaceae bacterium]
MKTVEAYTVSIGGLAVLDTYLTATVIPVPVWVTFLAWASFFVVGATNQALLRSVASNLCGLLISSLVLIGISHGTVSPVVVALAVGAGSALMVQASKVPALAVLPAIVCGFASNVGTVSASAVSPAAAALNNPIFLAAVALVIGNLFGYGSERLAKALTGPQSPVTP